MRNVQIRRGLGLFAMVLAGALGLAACGDSSGVASTGGTTAAPAAGDGYGYGGGSATTAAAAPTTAAPTTTVAVTATVKLSKTALGDVLTDDKGRTLYAFLRDEPSKSNCAAACLNTWPRYAPATLTAGAGVTGQLAPLTVDGVAQATIGGMPLYYFASDTAAGDTKGQGVGGNWYVVDGAGAVKK